MAEALTAQAAQANAPIHHSMTVAEINQKFPQCAAVFEKYGIAGCGGQFGPPEPLFIFAAAHHVPLRQLVDELNQAVRGEWKDDSKGEATAAAEAAEEEARSEQLFKRFVATSLLIALTFGMLLGVVNITLIAVACDYDEVSGVWKQVHGHAQIFGWIGLFIMGVAFHAVPRFKMTKLGSLRRAKLTFALMLAGVLLRAVSQPLAKSLVGAVALGVSGAFELAAIALFVTLLARVVLRSKQRRELYEKFIWASLLWLVALGVWNFGLTLEMATHQWTGIKASQNIPFIHVALFGFVANMIFGFSLRVVQHFLGLRDAKTWAANIAFVSWNAAILLRVASMWFAHEKLPLAASVLELAGAVLFVWSLGIFAKRRTKIQIEGVDNSFAWFIYLGYAWLVVAALQPFHADLPRMTASSRHAMTIGFMLSMMMGVAYRVLPIFNGVNLHSNKLMRVSFWLHAAGTSIVLAMAFSNRLETPWTFIWAAAAGYLVLGGVAMFAWNLFKTLRTKAEKFMKDSEVKLTTRVAELLDQWPELRPVLVHGGLSGLAAMRHNPPRFVTIEFAARRHGIDPQPLVELLNDEINRRKTK